MLTSNPIKNIAFAWSFQSLAIRLTAGFGYEYLIFVNKYPFAKIRKIGSDTLNSFWQIYFI